MQSLYSKTGELDTRVIREYNDLERPDQISKTEYLNNRLIGDKFTPAQKQLFHLTGSKLWHMARFQYVCEIESIYGNYLKIMPTLMNLIRNSMPVKKYCFNQALKALKENKITIDKMQRREVLKLFIHKDYSW